MQADAQQQGACGAQHGPQGLPESRSTLRGQRQTRASAVLVASSPEHTGRRCLSQGAPPQPGWGRTAAPVCGCLRRLERAPAPPPGNKVPY